jgi:hypothetical protein
MGMQVSMFFTFWGTAALRRANVRVKKTLLERMFGWMLPKGVKKLPLSQMNMAGGGPAMIRYVMKKNGVASIEDMIELSKEIGCRAERLHDEHGSARHEARRADRLPGPHLLRCRKVPRDRGAR